MQINMAARLDGTISTVVFYKVKPSIPDILPDR